MRLRVGLTGGIGSGKTEAGRVLRACGALLVDADVLSREAVAPGSEGLTRVARRWPDVVRDGELDRAALGAIVFADAEARTFLNGIVHPYVRARSAALEAQAEPGRIVVHDIPLLFESRYESHFDATVLVVAPRAARLERVERRSGLGAAETESRMAAQIDPEAARPRATYVVENDGTLEAFEARVRAVYGELAARPPRGETSEPHGL